MLPRPPWQKDAKDPSLYSSMMRWWVARVNDVLVMSQVDGGELRQGGSQNSGVGWLLQKRLLILVGSDQLQVQNVNNWQARLSRSWNVTLHRRSGLNATAIYVLVLLLVSLKSHDTCKRCFPMSLICSPPIGLQRHPAVFQAVCITAVRTCYWLQEFQQQIDSRQPGPNSQASYRVTAYCVMPATEWQHIA